MNRFPMFVSLEERIVLIAGGTQEVLKKAEKLMPFGCHIRMIAPSFLSVSESVNGVEQICKGFEEEDLSCDPAFVILGEKGEEAERIYRLCRAKGIPVNAVDQPALCDFYFPALITTRHLTIGIGTAGLSPAGTAELKQRIAAVLPDSTDDILMWLGKMRDSLTKSEISAEKKRLILKKMAAEAFSQNAPLEKGRVNDILKEVLGEC